MGSKTNRNLARKAEIARTQRIEAGAAEYSKPAYNGPRAGGLSDAHGAAQMRHVARTKTTRLTIASESKEEIILARETTAHVVRTNTLPPGMTMKKYLRAMW